MIPLFRRWSVIVLMLAAALYIGSDVPLASNEITIAKAPYANEYYVSRLYARHHMPSGKLMITMVVSPKAGGEESRINILYDRTQSSMTLINIEPNTTETSRLVVFAVVMLSVSATWLLYFDPLLAGRWCRRCRLLGFLPRPLKERERTVYPETLDGSGGHWPEIIETERYCPHCNYGEFSIREYSLPHDQYLGVKGLQQGLYLSAKTLSDSMNIVLKKIENKGLTKEEYEARLDVARHAASEKNTVV